MIHASNLKPSSLSRQADIFKALASPARLAIIAALEKQEMTVTDLVNMLEKLNCACSSERTNISKHLAVLRETGIVSSTGDGQHRIYSLEARCLIKAIECTVRLGDAGGNCTASR